MNMHNAGKLRETDQIKREGTEYVQTRDQFFGVRFDSPEITTTVVKSKPIAAWRKNTPLVIFIVATVGLPILAIANAVRGYNVAIDGYGSMYGDHIYKLGTGFETTRTALREAYIGTNLASAFFFWVLLVAVLLVVKVLSK